MMFRRLRNRKWKKNPKALSTSDDSSDEVANGAAAPLMGRQVEATFANEPKEEVEISTEQQRGSAAPEMEIDFDSNRQEDPNLSAPDNNNSASRDDTKQREDGHSSIVEEREPTSSARLSPQTTYPENTTTTSTTPSLQSSSKSSDSLPHIVIDHYDENEEPLFPLDGASDSLKEADVEKQNELHREQDQQKDSSNNSRAGKNTMSPWNLRFADSSPSSDMKDEDDMQTNSGEMEVKIAGRVEFTGIPKTPYGWGHRRSFFRPRTPHQSSASNSSDLSDMAVASESNLSEQLKNSLPEKTPSGNLSFRVDPVVNDYDEPRRINPFCFHDAFRCITGRKKNAQNYAIMDSSSESVYTSGSRELSETKEAEKSEAMNTEDDVNAAFTQSEPVQFSIQDEADVSEPLQFSTSEEPISATDGTDKDLKPLGSSQKDPSSSADGRKDELMGLVEPPSLRKDNEPVQFPVLSDQRDDETIPGAQLVQALIDDPSAEVTAETAAKALEVYEQKVEAFTSTHNERKQKLGSARDELRGSLKTARQLVKLKVGYEMAGDEIAKEINTTRSDLLAEQEQQELAEHSKNALDHTKAEVKKYQEMNEELQGLSERLTKQKEGFSETIQKYEEQNETLRSRLLGFQTTQQEARQLQNECNELAKLINDLEHQLLQEKVDPVSTKVEDIPDGSQVDQSKVPREEGDEEQTGDIRKKQRIESMRREILLVRDAVADTQRSIDQFKQQEAGGATADRLSAILLGANTDLLDLENDEDQLSTPESTGTLQVLRSKVRSQETNAKAEVDRLQQHRIVSNEKRKQLQTALDKSQARVKQLEAQLNRAESARSKRLSVARRSNAMRRRRQSLSQNRLVMSVVYPATDSMEGPRKSNLITNDKLNSLIYSKNTPNHSGRMGIYGQLLQL